ncbi:FKBP-type peptidyl-prolyl cis-trans isomerase [Thioalkalivibrio paradoxus]|uniref:Peptidyl-prolyl cis-trans isomerase n=1 Tax=Thioalkalivibrio paradoxus ARh 1 TaxID=713585 RepID=W0DPN2_9GAMM|nr:FKBP-type peptidyl-prolyl cis-trans isomerase [Thioalkalivibrio paradoxus]AHE98820.1 peptidylprolyl isomerase [Thioalkalivibrio paradoxus ARh 1]
MLKVILISLLALVFVFLGARSCGLTPEQIEERILLAEMNAEEGLAYRSENERRPGVVVWDNGLQVEVLREGQGTVPDEDDWVQVHYRGWHLDGREFENSWRRNEPATVPIERTIAGWREALVSTPVGTRLRLVVPPELAYGRAGGGRIGPEETLIFELELLAIVMPDPPREIEEWERPVPGLR